MPIVQPILSGVPPSALCVMLLWVRPLRSGGGTLCVLLLLLVLREALLVVVLVQVPCPLPLCL